MTERWKRAQRDELDYHTNRSPRDIDPSLGYFTIDFPLGRVLEVGCSPTAAIHGLKRADERTGLDPLADKYDYPIAGVKHIKGMGEVMPFDSKSFETVLCFNTLDHCLNPTKVLDEIKRVLAPGGFLLFSLNVFPSLSKKFIGNLDPEHPLHFSNDDALELLGERFWLVDFRTVPIDAFNGRTRVAVTFFGMRRLVAKCRK